MSGLFLAPRRLSLLNIWVRFSLPASSTQEEYFVVERRVCRHQGESAYLYTNAGYGGFIQRNSLFSFGISVTLCERGFLFHTWVLAVPPINLHFFMRTPWTDIRIRILYDFFFYAWLFVILTIDPHDFLRTLVCISLLQVRAWRVAILGLNYGPSSSRNS